MRGAVVVVKTVPFPTEAVFHLLLFFGFQHSVWSSGIRRTRRKKETWMSLMKHGHQWDFVHVSRTEKNISKNNLICLSSCIYILWLYRRSNYSAYNPRERCRDFNCLNDFDMLHIFPSITQVTTGILEYTSHMHTFILHYRHILIPILGSSSWRIFTVKSRFGYSQCCIQLSLWISLVTRPVSAPGQPICRQ